MAARSASMIEAECRDSATIVANTGGPMQSADGDGRMRRRFDRL